MDEKSPTWPQGLYDPKCFPHPIDSVRLVETHISWVLLTGFYAYKIKKPVKFSFVDFSTLEKRRWFCEEEVRLNRRLAPDLYMGVVPITGSPTSPEIEGHGAPFEFAVKMKQFSVEQQIDRILRNEEKAEKLISRLADSIATFHSKIEKAGEGFPYGSPADVLKAIKECLDELPVNFVSQTSQALLTAINTWLQTEWSKVSNIILQRKRAGFVRECHGDLHLGNLAIFKGSLRVFDALEFEPRLRWIDVLSEVAFLVMDLEKHGRQDLAYLFLNRYLELTGDYEGVKVFRLYLVYRALVRAKVAGLRLAQLGESSTEEQKANDELAEYVGLAHRYRSPVSPALILMHGISGTGKTTVSTEIIKAIGAIRVRSDVERKRLFAETLPVKKSQESDLYHSGMTERTYDQMRNLARMLIETGYPVVVDATFLLHHQRVVFWQLAQEQGCEWAIVDVSAPQAVLEERIERRSREGHDASDATIDVMKRQQKREDTFTQEEWPCVIGVDSTDTQAIVCAIEELKRKVEA